MRGKTLLPLLLLAADLALLNAAFSGVFYARYHQLLNRYFLVHVVQPYLTLIVVTNILYLAGVWALRTLRLPRRFGVSDVLSTQIRVIGLLAIGSIVIIFLTKGLSPGRLNFQFSRPTLVSFWIVSLLVTAAGRLVFGKFQRALFKRGLLVRRVLIVGPPAAAREIEVRIRLNPWFGARVVGIAVPGGLGEEASPGEPSGGPPWLAPAGIAEIEPHLAALRVDEVFAALPPESTGALMDLLRICRERKIVLRMLPRHFQMTASHFRVSEMAFLEGANRYDILFDLYGRVNHEVGLERARIAVIGSKGIPATFGGIERHVAELTSCLVERGFRVKVYCRPYYTSVSGEYEGVELVTLPTLYTKHLDAITHTLLSTVHALLSGVDIVHYHAMGPAVLSFIPRAIGVRTVATVHGVDWRREKWGRFASAFLRFGEYACATFPSRTIVVSRALERHFSERRAKRVTYVPNGLTVRAPIPPRRIGGLYGLRGRDYVLFVGRLVPEKGCHYLLEAFAGLSTSMRLVIAGGSSHSDDYVGRLHAMGRKDPRVLFTGYVHGDLLTELYSNACVFVLPSDLEGLSLSLLEALALGNAVLASGIPENEEVLLDSDEPPRGLTFRPGDPEDLRRQLGRLIEGTEERNGFAARGRDHVLRHYDWSRVADRTAAVYAEVLRHH